MFRDRTRGGRRMRRRGGRRVPACGPASRAKLFANGRSQAVRLPTEVRMPGFEVLSFEEEAARTHAEVRYALRSAPIGERDLLMAAIALPRSLILVTHNVREFRRVPGLRVEDWVRGDPVILRTPLTNGLPTSTAGRAGRPTALLPGRLSRQARFSTRHGSCPAPSRGSVCWTCPASCPGRSAPCCSPTWGW